jgi:hypothetical protein
MHNLDHMYIIYAFVRFFGKPPVVICLSCHPGRSIPTEQKLRIGVIKFIRFFGEQHLTHYALCTTSIFLSLNSKHYHIKCDSVTQTLNWFKPSFTTKIFVWFEQHVLIKHTPWFVAQYGQDQCCTGICPSHGSVKGYVHWFVIPAWTSGSYANTRFIPGHWMCLPTLNLVINPYLAQQWAWKPLNMHVFVHYDCFRRCTGLLCAQRTTGNGSY